MDLNFTWREYININLIDVTDESDFESEEPLFLLEGSITM